MEWVENQCACGVKDVDPLFVAEDLNFHATAETGTYCKCLRCDSIFPTAVPTEATIGEAYSSGYYTRSENEIGRLRRINRPLKIARLMQPVISCLTIVFMFLGLI